MKPRAAAALSLSTAAIQPTRVRSCVRSRLLLRELQSLDLYFKGMLALLGVDCFGGFQEELHFLQPFF